MLRYILGLVLVALMTVLSSFHMPTEQTTAYLVFVLGTIFILYFEYKEIHPLLGLVLSCLVGFFFVFFLESDILFKEKGDRFLVALIMGEALGLLLFVFNRCVFPLRGTGH